MSFSRRNFLQLAAATTSACALPSTVSAADSGEPFLISLAEWSLHRTLFAGKDLTNLDFPAFSKREFGIDAIEYVNQFFMDKAKDQTYLSDLKDRCDSEGVRSLLIMIDGEGGLGEPDAAGRTRAIENHYKWVDAAKFLGCHSVRVNARSGGTYQEQQKLAADGLARLSRYAQEAGLDVLVENHGGWSSHGEWLAGVIEMVDMDNCGTLPDFGNFGIARGDQPLSYDPYVGVAELMPYAKAVSAKTTGFDEDGNERNLDYDRLVRLVLDAGYDSYFGIEFSGSDVSEVEGIKKSKALLERIRETI